MKNILFERLDHYKYEVLEKYNINICAYKRYRENVDAKRIIVKLLHEEFANSYTNISDLYDHIGEYVGRKRCNIYYLYRTFNLVPKNSFLYQYYAANTSYKKSLELLKIWYLEKLELINKQLEHAHD